MTGLEGQNPSSALQAELFLRSMLLGLPAGLLLDCFRTLRALLPHHALLVFIEDTVYVFLCIFTVQCYVWMYAGGVFRWQYAAGACIGLAVYLATVGAVWMRMLRRLRCAVRRVLRADAAYPPGYRLCGGTHYSSSSYLCSRGKT